MGAYTITVGGSIEIDLSDDFRDNGWSISGSVAKHSSCNNGLIKLNSPSYKIGVPNTFRYVVSGYSSGTVQLRLGDSLGDVVSANGEHIDILTPESGDEISFYSDGNLSVEILDVYTGTEETTGSALYFGEADNKWLMYHSMRPEFMLKFIDSFFVFKEGRLWENNVNPVRNNFFGTQYPSIVKFISNFEPKKNKVWYNLRLDSKGSWFSPDMTTQVSDQFPNGMRSRLKKNNLKLMDGKLRADILRDIDDPAFATIVDVDERELNALFKARKLQGGYLIVTLQNNDATEARLESVEVYYIDAERNF